MAKKNLILISPAEAVKLRTVHNSSELSWARRMADSYSCRPLNANADDFYIFVADVFHAGRISGVREMRQRGQRYFDTAREISAFEAQSGKEISAEALEIIETFGEMINNAYAKGIVDGKKGVRA